MGNIFVRVPNQKIPRFVEVPDQAKYPLGQYRQAPPPFEPHWWLVSPWTSDEPWKFYAAKLPERKLPPGFEDVFGPKPVQADFPNRLTFQQAIDYWEQNLTYFKQAGLGDDSGFSAEQITTAQNLLVRWGLGNAVFYEGRYGFVARFPDCAVYDFDAWARDAIIDTHHLIAKYQERLLERGDVPEMRHPRVPPHLWPD